MRDLQGVKKHLDINQYRGRQYTMNTLAEELRHQIFEQCDLESLVALRQTSKLFQVFGQL